MKKKNKLIMTALLLSYLLCTIIIACKKEDPCRNTICMNGGWCSDGKCVCVGGYSGTNCQIYPNAAYTGSWTGVDCSGYANYMLVADPSSHTSFTFLVPFEFNSCGTSGVFKLTATINSSSNNFSTNTATMSDGCSNVYSITANGYAKGNSIYILFTVVLNGVKAGTCEFNGTK